MLLGSLTIFLLLAWFAPVLAVDSADGQAGTPASIAESTEVPGDQRQADDPTGDVESTEPAPDPTLPAITEAVIIPTEVPETTGRPDSGEATETVAAVFDASTQRTSPLIDASTELGSWEVHTNFEDPLNRVYEDTVRTLVTYVDWAAATGPVLPTPLPLLFTIPVPASLELISYTCTATAGSCTNNGSAGNTVSYAIMPDFNTASSGHAEILVTIRIPMGLGGKLFSDYVVEWPDQAFPGPAIEFYVYPKVTPTVTPSPPPATIVPSPPPTTVPPTDELLEQLIDLIIEILTELLNNVQ
jgi:hypothetical protein